MKLTNSFALTSLLCNATAAWSIHALIEPRQAKCSLYDGFADSPSFTSFCKTLPRFTPAVAAAPSSSEKYTPSISTQQPPFTFDHGGQTLTMSPNPAISSAAGGSTFGLQNYTVTTSGQATPTDVEVNCYINGSKVPMSECTRTTSLTRQHGYTYSPSVSQCTQNLTRLHGYTYSDGTAPAASTSMSTSYYNSYDCNNITNAEPHKTRSSVSSAPASSSSAPPGTITASPSVSGSASGIVSNSSSSLSTSYHNSYDCNNITEAEPHKTSVMSSVPYLSTASLASESTSTSAANTTSSSAAPPESETGGSFNPVVPAVQAYVSSSTTTIIDATVTTVVPCATDVGKPAQEKRDVFASLAGGMCDAGVYCVNSTYVSDAPPSWNWDAVALKQGQICLEDNVFNTPWVEQQCACAGLLS